MNQLVPINSPALPALVVAAGERAGMRFLEFFTANIRNPHVPFDAGPRQASFRPRPLPEEFLTNCTRETPLTAVLQYASRGVIRPRAERPGVSFRRHLSALAAQFFHARTDRRKIVSSAGAGHVSSVYRCEPGKSVVNYTIRNLAARQ
jgi:hypothetical protein